jgi:hypothetical protein
MCPFHRFPASEAGRPAHEVPLAARQWRRGTPVEVTGKIATKNKAKCSSKNTERHDICQTKSDNPEDLSALELFQRCEVTWVCRRPDVAQDHVAENLNIQLDWA